MDPFAHMTDVLTRVRTLEVVQKTAAPKEPKKTERLRKKSDTKKYEVQMIPSVYGTSMSALSYRVITLLLEEVSPQEIAKSLELNLNAVRMHKANVAKKLGVPTTRVLEFLRNWRNNNPNFQEPEIVELKSPYYIAGVELTRFKYRILKELAYKDIQEVARELKMSRDNIMSHRYQICLMFGLSWEDVQKKVQEFWAKEEKMEA